MYAQSHFRSSYLHTSVKVTYNSIIVLIALVTAGYAHAGFVVEASGAGTGGDAISVSAEFDFVTHDFGSGANDALQITLTNSSVDTNFRGNLLTGFFFSLDGVGALTTTSAGFDGLAASVYDNTDLTIDRTNVDIAPAAKNTSTEGMYQLSNGPFGNANSGESYSAYDYGIGTVGMGLTGFNGAAVGGDNYGIFAAGTNDLTEDGLGSVGSMIGSSAVFWILKPETLTSFSQITAARFGFGSLPDNSLIATIPEPGMLPLLAIGLAGLWIAGFKRHRRV